MQIFPFFDFILYLYTEFQLWASFPFLMAFNHLSPSLSAYLDNWTWREQEASKTDWLMAPFIKNVRN